MKILYLIHTQWDWILQRPQLLALELEKEHDCIIIDMKYVPTKKSNMAPNPQPKSIKKIIQIRGRRNRLIDKIDNFLYRLQLGRVSEYDCIWICYPSFIKYIPLDYKGYIIYDCMDNHVALAQGKDKKQEVYYYEQELIQRSSIVIASSRSLIESIPNLDKAVLVRNGFIGDTILPIKEQRVKEQYTIGYFGAIEPWFDFALIQSISLKFSSVDFSLIGPFKEEKFDESITKENLAKNRIFFKGTIDHKSLPDAIQNYDALIMPFIVNDIIISVDPVKLYEYIAYGKPVISIWYPEIDRFEPFVYFYRTAHELEEIICELCENGFKAKYNEKQRDDFLKRNNWTQRGQQVLEAVGRLIESNKNSL